MIYLLNRVLRVLLQVVVEEEEEPAAGVMGVVAAPVTQRGHE